jgi:hypothetical protein
LAYNKAYTQTPFVAPSNEGFGLVYNFWFFETRRPVAIS